MHGKMLHLAAASLTAAMVVFCGSGAALADADLQIAKPAVAGNLAVYPIESSAASGPMPLTVEQAERRGDIEIHENRDNGVTIDNHSQYSVFVPFGTLLTGGLQDQVIGTSALVPPKTTGYPLSIFCVDPFRTSGRGDERADVFSTSGSLMPSRNAALSMLLDSANSSPIWWLRQAGVWWSIDTLRSLLQQALGAPLEPARPEPWTPNFTFAHTVRALSSRTSTWTESLPRALTDLGLAKAQAVYLHKLEDVPKADQRAVGAVFVIDGEIAGAELYGSPELFAAMWPHLAVAYATQAIAASTGAHTNGPDLATIRNFISAARTISGEGRKLGEHTFVREGNRVLYAEDTDSNGTIIASTYLPTRVTSTERPDALIVDMLERGAVNGQSLAGLAKGDEIEFTRSRTDGTFAARVLPGSRPVTDAGPHAPQVLPPFDPANRTDRRRTTDFEFPQVPPVLAILTVIGILVCFRRRVLSRKWSPPGNYIEFRLALGKRYSALRVSVLSAWRAVRRLPAAVQTRLARPSIPSPLAVASLCFTPRAMRPRAAGARKAAIIRGALSRPAPRPVESRMNSRSGNSQQ